MELIMLMFVLVLFVLGISFWGLWKKRKIPLRKFTGEFFLAFFYVIAMLIFALALFFNSADHDKAVMEIDGEGYSPIGIAHSLTLLTYQILFTVSASLLWLSGFRLPPLTKVLALCFLLVGAVFSVMVIIQVSDYQDPNPARGFTGDKNIILGVLFSIMPACNIPLAIVLWVGALKSRKQIVETAQYKIKLLNTLNAFALKVYLHPYWLLPLTLPVFIIVTLLLMLVGQDWDSSAKVFTQTTCWRFSQMSHPDYLPHQGHYLCTVAARGHSKLVQPVRVGVRHGQYVIVNRQLMVANAFEELVRDFFPRLHHLLRTVYDKYGLPLSSYINTPCRSSITYVLMKPLEWFFLLALYLLCVHPEKKIARQYQPINH